MEVLVTGANGFVGRHVLAEMKTAGHTPLTFDQKTSPNSITLDFEGDIADGGFVEQMIRTSRPDAVIHLAGIAFVPIGWVNPEKVMAVNLGGTIHLLEACRKHAPQTRVLVVTSSEVYGREPRPEAIDENAPLAPANPYAVAKAGADMMALLTACRYEIPVMTARPDNHIGPGQSEDFVAPSFAAQLADMALGRSEPKMQVGNLESERDFMDVRDVARAYRLLVEKGKPGKAYNVASGKPIRIQVILDKLCATAGIQPEVAIDPARYRPADSLPTLDTTRIQSTTGWEPKITLNQTLSDIYQYILAERKQAGDGD